MTDLPPNHHAHFRQFSGAFGYVARATMTVGRGQDARLVAELADLSAADHVLDIGCGPGTAVRLAARAGALATGVTCVGAPLARPRGWTVRDAIAVMLTDHGFTAAEVSSHESGRRRVVTVTART